MIDGYVIFHQNIICPNVYEALNSIGQRVLACYSKTMPLFTVYPYAIKIDKVVKYRDQYIAFTEPVGLDWSHFKRLHHGAEMQKLDINPERIFIKNLQPYVLLN